MTPVSLVLILHTRNLSCELGSPFLNRMQMNVVLFSRECLRGDCQLFFAHRKSHFFASIRLFSLRFFLCRLLKDSGSILSKLRDSVQDHTFWPGLRYVGKHGTATRPRIVAITSWPAP